MSSEQETHARPRPRHQANGRSETAKTAAGPRHLNTVAAADCDPEHMLAGMADSAGGSGRARDRLPTIVDVDTQAGVSIATVSRVVTGAGRVREATRARVERAIAATGWTAYPAARVLAGGTGDEVVLAIAVAGRQQFADDPHYARVIAGACQE